MKSLKDSINEGFFQNVGIQMPNKLLITGPVGSDAVNFRDISSGNDRFMVKPMGGPDKRKPYHLEPSKNSIWNIEVSNIKGVGFLKKRNFTMEFDKYEKAIKNWLDIDNTDIKDIYLYMYPYDWNFTLNIILQKPNTRQISFIYSASDDSFKISSTSAGWENK